MVSEEEKLFEEVKQKALPNHIAIIMDGNGRWAKKRGLPRIMGHRVGTQRVREIVQACGDLKLEVLTLYTFSTENWIRPPAEINALMQLLCLMLRKEIRDLDKNNVQLRAIGRIHALPKKVKIDLERAMEKLSQNDGLILNLALNYGGRQEIVDAVNELIGCGIKKVDEKSFGHFLYTRKLRDPDLLIRTSGEQRISNFLIYQTAYSEFYTTKTLWPDFHKVDLYKAILEYQKRDRRFGGT